MDEKPFTWRQRFILFAIYFALLLRGVPLLLLIAPGLWNVRPRHGLPLHPWLEIALAIATGGVWLSETGGSRLLRYAVRRL